jgi:hypothetical protein
MYRIALSLLLPTLSFFPQSETRGGISEEFRKAYVQKVLRLKHFCQESTQRYTAEGELLSGCRVGPWTIYGPVLIEKISEKEKQLRIRGTRLATGWENGTQTYFRLESGIEIEISMDEPLDDRSAKRAMSRVFLSEGDKFADFVPEEWKQYFTPRPAALAAAAEAPTQDNEHAARMRVSSGVTQGRLVGKVPPVYPALAKSLRRRGKVVLTMLIGTQGEVKRLQVAEPAGFGLDVTCPLVLVQS